jgi:hypothetical protein
MTVSFWLKIPAFDSNGFCNLGTIGIFGVGGGINLLYGMFMSWSNGILSVSLINAFQVPYNTVFVNLSPDPDTFYFICMAHDPVTGLVKIRVDADPWTYSGAAYLHAIEPVKGLSINMGAFGIDGGQDSVTTFLLDEYSIWPSMLTDTQVDHLYNSGAGQTWPVTLPP